MPREILHRTAADNRYLHKDFHGALSAGIEYLHRQYGPGAVREYLHRFAGSFYAPLREELKRRGLVALEEHFARVYELEGGTVRFHRTEDELTIEVAACPAVTHMRRQGYPVAEMFVETTRTVNEAICEGTPFIAELLEYDPQSGRSIQRFAREPA